MPPVLTSLRDPIRRIWVACCMIYPIATLTSIAVTNILLILILLGWIFYRESLPEQAPKYLLVTLLGFIAWTLIATTFSPYQSNYKEWFREFSTMLAIIPGLVLASQPDRLRTAFRWASYILIALAIYATYQYFFGWDLIRSRQLIFLCGKYHATGLQDFHLTFAGVIGLTTPLGIVTSNSVIAYLIAFGSSSAILASMGRTIIVGYSIAAMVFLLFGSRKLKISGAIALLSLIILPFVVFNAAGERMARGVGAAGEPSQQGDPTRVFLWKSATNIIKHYPIAGIGYGNWNTAFKLYKEPYDHYSSTAHAHNDLLATTVKYGIIGGMIFAIFWGLVLFRCSKTIFKFTGYDRDLRVVLLATFLLILFGGLFQCFQTDSEDALILWMLIGIVIALPANSSGTELK